MLLCNEHILLFRQVQVHKKIEHEGRRHVCSKCGKSYKQITSMTEHEALCGTSDPRPFKCAQCTYNTTTLATLTCKNAVYYAHAIKGIVHLNIIFSNMKFNKICNLDHPVY